VADEGDDLLGKPGCFPRGLLGIDPCGNALRQAIRITGRHRVTIQDRLPFHSFAEFRPPVSSTVAEPLDRVSENDLLSLRIEERFQRFLAHVLR
jgi:hypothetical protein